jgi:hypothetical protein
MRRFFALLLLLIVPLQLAWSATAGVYAVSAGMAAHDAVAVAHTHDAHHCAASVEAIEVVTPHDADHDHPVGHCCHHLSSMAIFPAGWQLGQPQSEPALPHTATRFSSFLSAPLDPPPLARA